MGCVKWRSMNISLNSKGNEETPKDLKPSNTLRVFNHRPIYPNSPMAQF